MAETLPKAVLGGRIVAKYDPAKALEVIERLSGGETLKQICKSANFAITPAVFKRWMVNVPDLAMAYQAAMVASAATFEEEALEAARAIADGARDGTHVRAVEVKIGQLRWSAERRDPARFGQKSQVNVRVPIQINTSLDLGSDPGAVGKAGIYTVEAGPTGKPLVEEVPLQFSRKGKRILTPPRNPFKETQDEHVRTEGSQPSNREGDPGDDVWEGGQGKLRGAWEPGQGARDPGEEEIPGRAGAGSQGSGDEAIWPVSEKAGEDVG